MGVLLLAPTLTRPTYALALVGAAAALVLAWKSVAFPLGLAGVPSLVSAVAGSNPLPKGGATFLIASWIALAVLIVAMRREQVVPLRAALSLPVAMAVLLVGLMLLRLGPSLDQGYGSTKLQLYLADNVVLLLGAVFVGVGRRHLRLFLIVSLTVAALGALLLIVELVTGTAQQQYGLTSGRFAINAQQGAINLGRESSNGALIAIFLIIAAERLSLRLAAIGVLPVLLVALVAAGSRGPTVAFLIGLLALVALTAATGRARRQLLLVAAAMVAAGVFIPVLVPGSAIGRSLSAILGGANGLSSNGRSTLWSEAVKAFSTHPILGIGTGGFGAIDQQVYPHNLLLEMAAELGVVGLLAVGTMITSMLYRLAELWRRAPRAQRLEVTLLIALLASALVNAMFSGAIQDNADVWLWGGLGLGMSAAGARPASRSRRRRAQRPKSGSVRRTIVLQENRSSATRRPLSPY